MADYMTLLGSEDVSRAGRNMQQAAETMSSAASTIEHALDRHRQFLDDWLQRFSAPIEALRRIHELAHDKSTGPAMPDGYWEIRQIAGSVL